MATFKKPVVEVSSNNAKFTSGLNKASRDVNSFSKKTNASFSKLTNNIKTGFRSASTGISRFASKASAAFNKVRRGASKVSSSIFNIKNALLGAGAAAAGIKLFNVGRAFDASLADLSAITGATGKDLKFLEDAALEFGRTTTLSASKAAEAFTLVASAKPELLANIPALKAVTKEVITLAEASGSDLPAAAKILGSALNQFGAGAAEAARFVNVLAAGSKLGSSLVLETGSALVKSGVLASQAGVSFEELNAAIQILAEKSIKAEVAGTTLKNVFIRLEKQTNNNLKPSVVGLSAALKAAGKIYDTTTKRATFFGEEAVVGAIVLINQQKKLAGLTKSLTGTSIAYEQASIKANSFDGRVKSLVSAVEGFALALFAKVKPALTLVVNSLISFINGVTESKKVLTLLTIGVAVGGPLVLGLAAVAAGAWLLSFAIGAVSTAAVVLRGALSLLARHPIAAALVLVGSLVGSVSIAFLDLGAIAGTLGGIMNSVFNGAMSALERIGNMLSNIIDKIKSAINTLTGLRQSATTSLVDLLPGMGFDPNAFDTQNMSSSIAPMRNIPSNSPQKIIVEIKGNKDGLVSAVVSSPRFENSIQVRVNSATRDAARQVDK